LGTVSRVINGHSNVNAELRSRVEQSIIALGYRPNFVARSLRRRKSQSIGVVIPDITNPFFAELVKGLESEARRRQYTIILGNSEEQVGAERLYLEIFIDRMVDGLILVPTVETRKVDIRLKVPLVLVDRALPGHSVVGSDHRLGARDAVAYLIGLGHRRIACIAGPEGLPVATQRYEGYRLALESHRLPRRRALVQVAAFDYDSGYSATLKLLERKNKPTAIFASSDQQAIGAIRAVSDLGLRVPQDVSVFGFDDIPLASLVNPRLSTVGQSVPALSRAAISTVLRKDAEVATRAEHRFQTTLIVRESCGPPGVP